MPRLGAIHITRQTEPINTATVIFFHGSGSNGYDIKEWVQLLVKNFSFPHIKVMYPTAPLQPYSPTGGLLSHVWFDRAQIALNVTEKRGSLDAMEIQIKNLIKRENDAGIPSERIIVGGFSMGGALAFHTAYRWDLDLAGVFAFSSFLNHRSIVYEDLSIKTGEGVKFPQLLQLHGDQDDLIPLKWGEITHTQLKSLGVEGKFLVQEKIGHTLNQEGVQAIKSWIEELLPNV